MRELELNFTRELDGINFYPADELEEIAQNVKCIIATVAGSVCLDREFGINNNLLDLATPRAIALLQAEIIAKVNKFEPRARVTSVKIFADIDGKMRTVVRLKIA